MIIKDLELINFGKFNHKHVEFSKGLNIIYGENEAGKTTIHTFIRGMLFGIEKQRGKASGKDIYSKYEPWDNPANYQGKMRIEQDGKNYRIERNFNRNHKSFKVIDEDLGVELTPDKIDSLLAGINESCYYNTISISQLGSVTDRELEIILKNYAANLGYTKAMEINIKEAFNDLEKQRKRIMLDNKVGQESEVERALENAIEKLEISEEEQKQIVDGLETTQRALKEAEMDHRDIKYKDDKRLEEIAKQNERKDKLYQDVLIYTADVERNTSTLEKIKEHKAEIESKLSDMKVDSREALDKLVSKVTNRGNIPIFFLVLMLASIGVGAGIIAGNGGFSFIDMDLKTIAICGGAAGFFGILSIIKYFYNKKKKAKNLEKIKDIKKLIEEKETAEHEEVYVERQLKNKRDALENTQLMLKAENENDAGKEDFSRELEESEKKTSELREQINRAQWMVEQKQERDIETRNQIQYLQGVKEKIERAKQEVAAIDQAREDIENIAEEIRNSFGKKLNERASYYMGQITNGKYDNLSIDDKLNISVNSSKSLINSNKLSKGTVEQIYMSLRLGAADLLFEGNPMPILLDDAFAMYDNRRMGNTMRYMAQEMNQVILFSCHTREKVMADKLDLNYHLIRL